MRRLIIWTVILFVVLGGVLTGHRSAAQEDGPYLLMIVYDRKLSPRGGYGGYNLYLQDPFTGKTWPLSIEQFRRYLQEGNIYYDPQLDLYKWIGMAGPSSLVGGLYVEIISNEYTSEVGYESLMQASPDWNWVVYWIYHHVYAVNLDEGIPRDLFVAHGLTQFDEFFGVAFSPDGETIYVHAQDAAGNDGLYRLRLDGSDTPGVQPIAQTNLMPMMWLEGTDSFVGAQHESGEGYTVVSLVRADGDMRTVLTHHFYDNDPDEVRFVGWVPQTQTLVWSAYSSFPSGGSGMSLFGFRLPFDFAWGILGWWPLGMTADREWLILYSWDQLARIRTDGSLFEVVTDIADGSWNRAIYSPDGDSVAVWSFDDGDYILYLVDMESGKVIERDFGQADVGFGLANWTPDGKWLLYGAGNRAIITDVHGNVVREYINDEQSHYFLTWVTLDELP